MNNLLFYIKNRQIYMKSGYLLRNGKNIFFRTQPPGPLTGTGHEIQMKEAMSYCASITKVKVRGPYGRR